MKIIQLQSQNIKNLKAIEITPDGNAVILTGPNGAGKSAVLDSILMALTGKAIDKPIRKGEDRAEVVVDLGDFVVKKVWTDKGVRLEVINPEGAKFASPQALLDKIMGKLSFDPLGFAKLSETAAGQREQGEVFLQAVGLDFTTQDQKRQELYTLRTDQNREIKRLEAQFGSMPAPEANLPERISVSDEMEALGLLEKRQEERAEVIQKKAEMLKEMDLCQEDIAQAKEEIAEHQKAIKGLQKAITSWEDKAEDISKKRAATLESPSYDDEITAQKEKITQAGEINAKVQAQEDYKKIAEEFKEAQRKANKSTQAIEKIDQEKAQAISACDFPVKGLAVVADGTVWYKNVPFSQLSSGEQIRISTAIAMALNPKLRIILIREGSLLDAKGLQTLLTLSNKKDYQVWIEKVQDKAGVGIYIEEGEIK